MDTQQTREMLIKFPPASTYEEATEWQTYYYDTREHPYDANILADKLNTHFDVTNFRAGKPRAMNEAAIAIRWPPHRKERKPIKMELQSGVTLTDL